MLVWRTHEEEQKETQMDEDRQVGGRKEHEWKGIGCRWQGLNPNRKEAQHGFVRQLHGVFC